MEYGEILGVVPDESGYCREHQLDSHQRKYELLGREPPAIQTPRRLVGEARGVEGDEERMLHSDILPQPRPEPPGSWFIASAASKNICSGRSTPLRVNHSGEAVEIRVVTAYGFQGTTPAAIVHQSKRAVAEKKFE